MRSAALLVCSITLLFGYLAGAAESEEPDGAPGIRVDLDGRRLHLFCLGRGAPTVVLEAGLGGNSLEWRPVQKRVGAHTRVCAYDRPGYGWSDPRPEPRTSDQIARELRAALTQAGVPGPYVLVGHSFGGFNVRMFAARYPDQSAAVVLVDAAHEDQFERMQRGPAATRIAPSTGHFVLLQDTGIPDGMPESLRPLAEHLAGLAKTRQTVFRELRLFEFSARQVRQFAPTLEVPLIVVSRAARIRPPGSSQAEQTERIWGQLQVELTGISRQSVHLTATSDSHHVHLAEPDLVARAILMAVRAARHGMPPGS